MRQNRKPGMLGICSVTGWCRRNFLVQEYTIFQEWMRGNDTTGSCSNAERHSIAHLEEDRRRKRSNLHKVR